MTTAKHIETARKHLAAGNVQAYKLYMQNLIRRAMSQRTVNQILTAAQADGVKLEG